MELAESEDCWHIDGGDERPQWQHIRYTFRRRRRRTSLTPTQLTSKYTYTDTQVSVNRINKRHHTLSHAT